MSQLKSLPPWLQDDSVQPLNTPLSTQQSSSTPSDANYANANLTNSNNNNNIKQPTFNFPLEQSTKIQLMHWIMKVLLMALCVLMFVTAVIGIGYIDGIESSGKIFIAVYMLFFSSLLFAFEFIRIRPVDWIDHMLLRNFGFLYGALGKSLFIIFIAFLSFGLGMPESLTSATGSSLALYGIIQFVIYLKYPEFFDGFI